MRPQKIRDRNRCSPTPIASPAYRDTITVEENMGQHWRALDVLDQDEETISCPRL